MKRIFTFVLLLYVSLTSVAQDTIQHAVFGNKKRTNMNATYHRSSWHNILISHKDQKYAEEILSTYYARPQSDKFNDHSLEIDVVTTKGKKYAKKKHIDNYVFDSGIANDLVAKWFNRNETTGYCDMNLIYRRGLEGATTEQIETSELAKLGKSILMDSGTDLIGNTFVLVHDVVYIDKGERNKKVAEGFRVFGEIMNAVMESSDQSSDNKSNAELGRSINDLTKITADIVDDF